MKKIATTIGTTAAMAAAILGASDESLASKVPMIDQLGQNCPDILQDDLAENGNAFNNMPSLTEEIAESELAEGGDTPGVPVHLFAKRENTTEHNNYGSEYVNLADLLSYAAQQNGLDLYRLGGRVISIHTNAPFLTQYTLTWAKDFEAHGRTISPQTVKDEKYFGFFLKLPTIVNDETLLPYRFPIYPSNSVLIEAAQGITTGELDADFDLLALMFVQSVVEKSGNYSFYSKIPADLLATPGEDITTYVERLGNAVAQGQVDVDVIYNTLQLMRDDVDNQYATVQIYIPEVNDPSAIESAPEYIDALGTGVNPDTNANLRMAHLVNDWVETREGACIQARDLTTEP